LAVRDCAPSHTAEGLRARTQGEAQDGGGARGALEVWFSNDDLVAGLPWQRQLEEAIDRRASAFTVYLGSTGVVNWVEAEVELALSRATRTGGEWIERHQNLLVTGPTGTACRDNRSVLYQRVPRQEICGSLGDGVIRRRSALACR